MTPQEREDFYDKEIAPGLLELATKCREVGIPFLFLAEITPETTGETVSVPAKGKGLGIKALMTYWAIISRGNADHLIMKMLKHSKEYGHNSVFIHMLERIINEEASSKPVN